ncbi:MAG: winged helix DNA-binding domain-containing protein [Streptosporangiaceae bacterium]
MSTERVLARRLANQQLAAPRSADPADVARQLGAVQSQEYAQSLWALGLRTQGASAASVEAAIDRGAILRTWPMRGTIHLVPAEDAHWMVRLLAGRRIRSVAGVYERIGLTPDVLARAAGVVTGALRGGQQIRRKDLYALLTSNGIDCSASPNGGRGNHILGYLSMTGLLCIGPVERGHPMFVLLDEWAPASRQPADPAAELAVRYFTSHGPATMKDFGWWSGLTLAEIRQAIEVAGPALTAEDHAGEQYWSGAGQPAAAAPEGAVLLPAFDEYTVAYKDRAILLDGLARPPSDLLNPVMLLDGRAVGVWKRVITAKSVQISLAPYGRLGRVGRARFEAAAQWHADFHSLSAEISLADPADVRRMRWL